jgi:hypothetical protein
MSAPVDQSKPVVVIGEDDKPIARLLHEAINDEAAYQVEAKVRKLCPP